MFPFNRLFKAYLGRRYTEPFGTQHLVHYRHMDKYTRCTESDVKEGVIKSFCNPNGNMRVVIATIAFGMGLDCPDVRHYYVGCPIRYGVSHPTDRKGGRDGYVACATILYANAAHQLASDAVMEFWQNNSYSSRASISLLTSPGHAVNVCVVIFVNQSVCVICVQ